jgi:hypothetical protein
MATAQIKVKIYEDGRIYPASSHDFIPEQDIERIDLGVHDLLDGDIVVAADGEPFVIHPGIRGVPRALTIQTAVPAAIGIHALELPLTRIYSCGEPRHDLIV